MKSFINLFVAAVMVILGMDSMQVEATPIQYTFNDYPAEQGGANFSGTITVDDSNGDGNLLAAEITSWQVQITNHPTQPDIEFGTMTPGSSTLEQVWGFPRVSATEISILDWFNASDKGDLVLTGILDSTGGQTGKLTWSRDVAWGTSDVGLFRFINGFGTVDTSDDVTYWQTGPGGTLGGNTEWIIASDGVPVPEPSAFVLAVFALAGLVAVGRRT